MAGPHTRDLARIRIRRGNQPVEAPRSRRMRPGRNSQADDQCRRDDELPQLHARSYAGRVWAGDDFAVGRPRAALAARAALLGAGGPGALRIIVVALPAQEGHAHRGGDHRRDHQQDDRAEEDAARGASAVAGVGGDHGRDLGLLLVLVRLIGALLLSGGAVWTCPRRWAEWSCPCPCRCRIASRRTRPSSEPPTEEPSAGTRHPPERREPMARGRAIAPPPCRVLRSFWGWSRISVRGEHTCFPERRS